MVGKLGGQTKFLALLGSLALGAMVALFPEFSRPFAVLGVIVSFGSLIGILYFHLWAARLAISFIYSVALLVIGLRLMLATMHGQWFVPVILVLFLLAAAWPFLHFQSSHWFFEQMHMAHLTQVGRLVNIALIVGLSAFWIAANYSPAWKRSFEAALGTFFAMMGVLLMQLLLHQRLLERLEQR